MANGIPNAKMIMTASISSNVITCHTRKGSDLFKQAQGELHLRYETKRSCSEEPQASRTGRVFSLSCTLDITKSWLNVFELFEHEITETRIRWEILVGGNLKLDTGESEN